MTVETGDKLDIEMTVEGNIVKQVATNRSNGKSVSFSTGVGGQPQHWALFSIEVWEQEVKPVEDIIFTDTVLELAQSAPDACMPSDIGPNDWLTNPRISKDGKTCCISKMILRAHEVPATTPNEP